MVLHFTDRLRKKLHIPELTRVDVAVEKHLRWYANLFTAQRAQYILTTNAASLFSVVIYGRGLRDSGDYHQQFLSELRVHLEDLELGLIYDRVIAPKTGEITLAKTADRSVLGSMNDMVNHCKFCLEGEDTSPWVLSQGINGTPFKALGYRFPKEVFARMGLENGSP